VLGEPRSKAGERRDADRGEPVAAPLTHRRPHRHVGHLSDPTGQGSVAAARMAVEDFGGKGERSPIEVLAGDHQNKPDVGSNLARQWLDIDKVDAIVDVPTSSVALAVNQLVRDANKVFIASGAATSDLTGKACSPNTCNGPTTPGRWPTAPARRW
jgi:hypothetical protein